MPETHEVFRDNEMHICSTRCSTCIFRPGNLMHLNPGRVKGMVEEALKIQGMIPCHKTIRRDDVRPAICRGFWDSYKKQLPILLMAEAIGIITEDEPPHD